MHYCIPTTTTNSNTSTGMIWVTLNMPSAAEECREPSGKCQGILHCLESGHLGLLVAITLMNFGEQYIRALLCQYEWYDVTLCGPHSQSGEHGLWTEILLDVFIKCNSYLKKAGIQNYAYKYVSLIYNFVTKRIFHNVQPNTFYVTSIDECFSWILF